MKRVQTVTAQAVGKTNRVAGAVPREVLVARMNALVVPAAMRARSPSSGRRQRKYGRSRLGIEKTNWRWGTGASSSSSSQTHHSARRLAWQLGQK